MIKTIVPLKGMHCKSCEILIGENLQDLPSVTKVDVSLKNKEALIYSKSQLTKEQIKSAVESAGYEVGYEDKKHWLSRNESDYLDIILTLIVLAVLYVVLSLLGLTNINLGQASASSGLLMVLVIGLTAGVSTCMAMVGGLVLGVSARHAEKHPEATSLQKFRPHIFFNLGRILSYFILGGVIGMLGKVFQLSGSTLGVITMLVGLVMLVLGLKLTEISPKLSSTSLTLPSSIGKFLGIKKRDDKEYSHLNSMLVGALTFFLPCGFTQAMQLFAMTSGSFLSGALIMGVFAIGTAPGLLGIGGITSLVKGNFAKKMFKFVGVLVAIMAILNIVNGYNLTGWTLEIPSPSGNTTTQEPTALAPIENGVQIVKMGQSDSGYFPNQFVVKKGIPVKWIINATSLNSCSASISMPKMGILAGLQMGENVFEFTPKETGTLKFTCGMGMYPGSFKVVD